MLEHSIAIIGMGMISKSHIAAAGALSNAKIAAVADTVYEKASKVGEKLGCPFFTDAAKMLKQVPEIDICIIALPTFLHGEYSRMCLEAGKNVMCEKPLEKDLEGAVKIRDAVKKSGRIFMTAQVVRFWPGYVKMKQMHDEGSFGEIYMSYFSRCSQIQKWDNNWLFDPKKGGGALHDMMVHDVDYANSLFGKAKSVYSIASKDDTGCYSNVFSSICYSNGGKSAIETSFSMKDGYPFTMYAKIMGSKATAEYTFTAGFDVGQREDATSCLRIYRESEEPVIEEPDQYDPYTRQLAYFIDCVENMTQPSVVTVDDSVEVISTVDAIERSADTGQIVYL